MPMLKTNRRINQMNNSTRRASSLILVFMLMVCLFAFMPLSTTTANLDSASTWARGGIAEAIEKGFVPWHLQYNYTNVITRSEFCSMAVKFVEYATGRPINAILAEKGLHCNPDAFSDTDDPNILAAFALGITSGTSAPTATTPAKFTPNGQFSREQAATMIRNVCRVIGADVDDAPEAGYADIGNAASWAVDSINYCYANRIMVGTSTAIFAFSPKATFTREQSIIAFNNVDNTDLIERSGIIRVPASLYTQAWGARNWANVSSVQQFAYMNEGLAYAYVMDNDLVITTSGKKLSIENTYPLLGDVISDDDGNFYVVWGRANETNDTSFETLFISKYSPDGVHVKTTGFVGDSFWGNSGKIKIPFSHGNCVSVIANGILVNYHGRSRYDGHQSDGVVALRISDMRVYDFGGSSYSGHSFNQSVIFCEKTSDFLFASHCDAFARGFRINDRHGRYGAADEIVFHFYLESNASYNMGVVNKTFAQLGGLAETSTGVALVGASAKSISEAAKEEKQNLFVQIFNPRATRVSPSMFVGGTTHSGATSFDIYDSSNSPLTPVTDYGVHWLTDYTDRDVVAPQVVAADDRVVILWSTEDGNYETVNDSFYMVLSSNGTILTPATSLGGVLLNSFERPVYHDGCIYWAETSNGRLRVRSIEIQNIASEGL